MISVLYFDLGGVVFDFHPINRLQKMSQASGLSMERLQTTLFDSGFSDDCDAGLYSAEDMYLSACERLAWKPSYSDFQALWISAFSPNSSVIAVVRHLSTSYQIGLLTNNPPILREALSVIEADFDTLFNPILFSGELKVAKPEPAIFHLAVQAVNCPAEQILFIDDSLRHLEAAQQVGLNTIHFTTSTALKKDLERFGIQTTERGR